MASWPGAAAVPRLVPTVVISIRWRFTNAAHVLASVRFRCYLTLETRGWRTGRNRSVYHAHVFMIQNKRLSHCANRQFTVCVYQDVWPIVLVGKVRTLCLHMVINWL